MLLLEGEWMLGGKIVPTMERQVIYQTHSYGTELLFHRRSLVLSFYSATIKLTIRLSVNSVFNSRFNPGLAFVCYYFECRITYAFTIHSLRNYHGVPVTCSSSLVLINIAN